MFVNATPFLDRSIGLATSDGSDFQTIYGEDKHFSTFVVESHQWSPDSTALAFSWWSTDRLQDDPPLAVVTLDGAVRNLGPKATSLPGETDHAAVKRCSTRRVSILMTGVASL